MKIEKRLWITMFVFGLFAICFSGWIFSQSTTREKLFWDNTIQCETKELEEGEIKSENIALPEDFDIPRSILFKTTHTIAEVWLDGEKIYEYGNEADVPDFMKSPGSCWHIVDIPGDSAGKSLEVRIIPVYEGYYGNKVSLVYGTRGDCILKILTDSLGNLVISCGILFAAGACGCWARADAWGSGSSPRSRGWPVSLRPPRRPYLPWRPASTRRGGWARRTKQRSCS